MSSDDVGSVTCDGVVGERLHVGQVVVWTVFLQPFANILLRPEHDGADQAGLRRACVIYPVTVTGTILQPDGQTDRRQTQTENMDMYKKNSTKL